MKLSTLELAKLIITSLEVRNRLTQQLIEDVGDNRLLAILLQADVENLAYWLSLHSFTKYQFEQKLKNIKEINIAKPSNQVINAVNTVIHQYFQEQLQKKNLDKFIADDFAELPFFARRAVLKDLLEVTLLGQTSITAKNVQYLINSKSRTADELGRHLDLKYISAKSYASESTTRRLAKSMLDLKPGDRRQILYYYLGQEHAFGFDVEVDANGKLKIFCFESAGDPRHLEGIDRLYQYLKKSGRDFEIRTCRAQMQKDSINCGLYVISALNEFAKYDHVYDYIEEGFIPDTSLHDYKEEFAEKGATLQKIRYTFPNLDKITWVKLSDMPTKIISMGQSYGQMVDVLNEKKFDLDPDKFVEKVQERDKYQEGEDKSKYISRRREHIANRLKDAQAKILRPAYEDFLKNNPIFNKINNGENVDYHQEITLNPKYSTLREKLDVLSNYMQFLLVKNEITLNYVDPDKAKSMPLNDQRAFFEMRNEYLRAMSGLSLQEFKKEYEGTRSPLKTKLDSFVDFSKFKPPIESSHDVVLKNFPDYLMTILKQDYQSYYPHYFTIPNPLKFDPNKINEITEESVRSQINKIAAIYHDDSGETILNPEMVKTFLTSFAQDIDKKMVGNVAEKKRLFAILQPIYLSYVAKSKSLYSIVNELNYNILFNNELDIEEAAKLDPPLKTTKELATEVFTEGQIAYLRTKLNDNAKRFFPPIEAKNPILAMLGDKENLKRRFTAKNILEELIAAKKKFTYEENQTFFPAENNMRLLQETAEKIFSEDENSKLKEQYNFSDKDFNYIFYQMSSAYYLLADQSDDPKREIILNQGILRKNLLLMLGDDCPKLTVGSLLKALNYLKDPFAKLQILQYAFYDVLNGYGYVNKNRLSLSRYSKRQQEDIKALQQAFLVVFAEAAKNKSDKNIRDKLKETVRFAQHFIDFHAIIFAKFLETDMRKAISKLLPPEYIPPPIRPSKTEVKKVEKESVVRVAAPKPQFFPQAKPKDVGEIALEYYNMEPMLTINGVTSEYVQNKTYDLTMYKFSFNELNPYHSLWVSYGSAKAPVVDEGYDWKFNLSVDGKDIEKALKIMAAIIVKYNIGAMKVMSQAQYNFTRNNPIMAGREFVVYCHHNPEISSQKWLDIIQEIEKKFDEEGIKPSVDKCPISNRQIGKYTSYTHEAWTAKQMDISFEEGIKEAALDDEDPFQSYTYVPSVLQKAGR